jgi:hypothetical protein
LFHRDVVVASRSVDLHVGSPRKVLLLVHRLMLP